MYPNIVPKLPGGLTERWNRQVSTEYSLNTACKPDLEDLILYTEEETMLMSNPLFSREVVSELNPVIERPVRRNTGPDIFIIKDRSQIEHYGTMFICISCRAVHIEITHVS